MTITELRPDRTTATVPDLHVAFIARRATEPGVERLLDIVVEVLARSDRPVGSGLRTRGPAWTRLLGLLDEQRDAPTATAACAAGANLVGLAVWGAAVDHAALADLADLLGHDELARLQHRVGQRIEPDATLPITTDVVRHLLGGPLTGADLRAAHALLLQGVDEASPAPGVETVEEFLDIAENGSITEWRHLMRLVRESAWSPHAVRLAELAAEAGHAHAASVIAALIDLSREQQHQAERDTVAREIGRLVALSGVPQAEFAEWMGTTPDHLSTYASGTVTPSAAVMLRISRTSLALQRRAAFDATVGGPRLLSVAGGRASRAVG